MVLHHLDGRLLHTTAIEVGEIHLSTNRVRVQLRSYLDDPDSPGVALEFDERHDALIAAIVGPGWLNRLSEDQTRVLNLALIGLLKKCGVDWVHATPAPRPDEASHPVATSSVAPLLFTSAPWLKKAYI